MTSPSDTAFMEGQRCPEEMRNSTRLWIWRDPSPPRDSQQSFYRLEHHLRAAVVARSWHIVDHCQTIDVEGRRHTVKLQSVLRLCSGFYRSKDPTNSIKDWSSIISIPQGITDVSSVKICQTLFKISVNNVSVWTEEMDVRKHWCWADAQKVKFWEFLKQE